MILKILMQTNVMIMSIMNFGDNKMTEKRFSVKQRQGATNYSITDYYGELPLSEGIYYKSNANKLCKWLNTQHELLNALYNENEQLKSENQSWLKTASHFDNVAHKDRCYAKRMHKENEQLKKENKKLNCIIKQLEAKYEDKGFSLAYDMGECE